MDPRALAMLSLSLSLVAAATTVAAAATPPTGIEDQNDRLLRNLQAGQAQRTQAAVAQARSMERNLTPVAAAEIMATQPAARPDTASPGAGVDVLAILLLGLVGGLVGGVAMAGLTAATRRRLQRTAAA